MIDYPEMEHPTVESAIRAGSCFYFDKELYENENVSGGVICPKCSKWTTRPRKRKFPMHSWIHDCESCEITDDFQRMWHKFNMTSTDMERDMHNNWLHQVRHYLEEARHDIKNPNSSGEDIVNAFSARLKLKELLFKIPFFEGMPLDDR